MTRFALPAAAVSQLALGLSGLALAWTALHDIRTGPECRPDAQSLARIELLFGSHRAGGTAVSEADWQSFLDAEVTPRFPAGLTVLTGAGQWRNTAGQLVKEQSRILVVWQKLSADQIAAVEAIRSAYKSRFAQESVMHVVGRSCVSF